MTKHSTKEMLINTVEGQECRIAIVRDGELQELYVERSATASHVGNIYKGRITNVEAAIQAAFVDTGLGKNGFLHVSDVNPTYFPKGKQSPEKVGHKRPHYVRPPIQECLKRGQEVVVQMTKEGIGTKGPTITTYLSIPGRLLVMMPGMTRLGVSRKVEDDESRAKARAALEELKLPDDIGFIVRTAGVDRSKRDLQRDLNYLLRLWKAVKQRIQTARAPVELYRESDLVTRTIRDIYDSDIDRVVCDSEAVARRVIEFLSVAVPRTKHNVELYAGKEGLFYDTGLEAEIEKIHARRVELRSGGSLVIDQTEAMVAIDVNSGRFRQHSDAETTALKTNVEAAKEIVRQLRLRDLGGVILMDFIDMREERNRRELERTLRDALKDDRAKTKMLRISAFGIVEMTRQRLGPSLRQSAYDRCPHCDGTGVIQSEESLSLYVMRNIERACAHEHVARIEVSVPLEVAHFLSNRQRAQLAQMEARTERAIIIQADPDLPPGTGQVRCTNSRGSEVAWDQPPAGKGSRQQLSTTGVEGFLPAAEEEPESTPADELDEFAEADQAGPDEPADAQLLGSAEAEDAETPRKKPRRGRRGGRKHRRRREPAEAEGAESPTPEAAAPPKEEAPPEAPREERPEDGKGDQEPEARPKAKKRRRRKSTKRAASTGDAPKQDAPSEDKPKPPDGKDRPAEDKAPAPPQTPPDAAGSQAAPPKAKKATRRRRTRRKPATPDDNGAADDIQPKDARE